MKTLRHYFICDNLDVVDQVEEAFRRQDVSPVQLHVLTNDEAEAEKRELTLVASLSRTDLVRSLTAGASVGAVAALFVTAVVALLGLPGPILGWTPYVMLAVVIFGFCTWEGGLMGIEQRNSAFEQFEETLAEGRHVFFADLRPEQVNKVLNVMQQAPDVELNRLEQGRPRWLVTVFESALDFINRNLLRLNQVS